MYTQATIDRFWSKVVQGEPDECWPYLRYATGGYGQIAWKALDLGTSTTYAHRLAYEIEKGPIPDGYVIDHECHNRAIDCPGGKLCAHRRCCNPRHLVAKTIGANVRDARSGKRKTHCPHGHEWTPKNSLVLANGWRQCRKCAAIRTARYKATH